VQAREVSGDRDGSLRGVDWYGERLIGRRFERYDFNGADLTEADSRECVFDDCDFSNVRFNASRHERTAFLNCRFRKVSFFDAELRGCKLTGSRFEAGCTFQPLTVERGDWSLVSMRGQDLSRLMLDGVRLREADLSEANLTGTSLRGADLSYAILRSARMRRADLRAATLEGVDLRQVDLNGVRLDLTQAVLLATQYGAEVDWE
jgi:uncharacterized protein YjbI with pentapeptide repeats